MTSQISRRSMLKAAGAAGVAVTAATALPATAADSAFAHPGLLHTQADLARMAAKVKAGAAPYTAGFAKLTANRHAQSGWTPNPQATVYRGAGSPQNYATLYNDIHAAYQNGLRHHVSGDSAYADTAVAILNAWSAKLTSLEGSADRFLAAGLYGYQFANAAELVRDHPDFDLSRFQEMLTKVFAPLSDDFLVRHNGAVITNYWTNWDLCAMACVLATGIFCDDASQVARAVDYFKHGEGLGSVKNAIPVVYDDGLAEWLEAGRDQGHALLGVGLMGTFCEMAWNQGYDLYGYDDSRFLKGAQYVAKWGLGGRSPTPRTPARRGRSGGGPGGDGVRGGRRRPRDDPPHLGDDRQPLHEAAGAFGVVHHPDRGEVRAGGWGRGLRPQQRGLRPTGLRHAGVHAGPGFGYGGFSCSGDQGERLSGLRRATPDGGYGVHGRRPGPCDHRFQRHRRVVGGCGDHRGGGGTAFAAAAGSGAA